MAVKIIATLSWAKCCSKMMCNWALGCNWLSGLGRTMRTLMGSWRMMRSHQALQRSAYQNSRRSSNSTNLGAWQTGCNSWCTYHTFTHNVGPVSACVTRESSSNRESNSICQIGLGRWGATGRAGVGKAWAKFGGCYSCEVLHLAWYAAVSNIAESHWVL